ncbi:MAG: hypothetical protein R3218_00855, partial [Christiangramia sp.]|nr:hypothetical protein [Christiangramia sp.]
GKQELIEMPHMKNCDAKTLNLVSHGFDIDSPISNYEELDIYWKDYVLFSNKSCYEGANINTWKNNFNNDKMKKIATNSISK